MIKKFTYTNKLSQSLWNMSAAVETYKQVYLFYQAPYQSNAEYLAAFKTHLKLSNDCIGDVGYYPGLVAAALLKKHSITKDSESEE